MARHGQRFEHGWFKLWIIEWFLHQALHLIPDQIEHTLHRQILTRHATDAVTYLRM